MGRWLSLIAIACAVSAAGCGSRDAPAAKPATGSGGQGQFAVGHWSVTAIDGKPVPEGSSVSLDYRSDGQLVVETTGNDAPSLDKEALKVVLNGLQEPSSPMGTLKMAIDSLTVNVNGRLLEMNWKSGTASSSLGNETGVGGGHDLPVIRFSVDSDFSHSDQLDGHSAQS